MDSRPKLIKINKYVDLETNYFDSNFETLYNVCFSTIMLIGVIGNVMIILVILRTKNMRNSTNIFLANLALADIMILLVWCTTILLIVNSNKNVAAVTKNICFAESFIRDTVTYASVLTILAISIDRYFAICKPLEVGYFCTKSRAYKIVILVWAVAALSNFPQLIYTVYEPGFLKRKVSSVPNPEIDRSSGREIYPEDYHITDTVTRVPSFCRERTDSFLNQCYYIVSASLFFFLPLVILVILFLIIARHLRGTASAPNFNTAAIRHRRHVITMLAAVIVCFFVCQMPYRVKSILQVILQNERTDGENGSNNLLLFCRMMICLHSALNPILYILMSQRFRAGFKQIGCDIVNRFSRLQGSSGASGETSTTTALSRNNMSVDE